MKGINNIFRYLTVKADNNIHDLFLSNLSSVSKVPLKAEKPLKVEKTKIIINANCGI